RLSSSGAEPGWSPRFSVSAEDEREEQPKGWTPTRAYLTQHAGIQQSLLQCCYWALNAAQSCRDQFKFQFGHP
ncbi:MAG: hypothetical protein AAGG44_15135, partial [Planctomycetota bacterium]